MIFTNLQPNIGHFLCFKIDKIEKKNFFRHTFNDVEYDQKMRKTSPDKISAVSCLTFGNSLGKVQNWSQVSK